MQRRLDTKNYARTYDVQELPSLIEVQLNSFNWFRDEGLGELFSEISPIESFNGNLKLYFPGFGKETEQFGLKYRFEDPKYDEDICLERDMTYSAPLYVQVALVNRDAGVLEVISDNLLRHSFPTRRSSRWASPSRRASANLPFARARETLALPRARARIAHGRAARDFACWPYPRAPAVAAKALRSFQRDRELPLQSRRGPSRIRPASEIPSSSPV